MDLSKCVTFGELGRLRDFSIVNLTWSQYSGSTISVSDNTLYVLQSMGDSYDYSDITFDISGNKTFAYTSFIQMDNPADYVISMSAADREIFRKVAFDFEETFLIIYNFIEVGDEYFWTTTSYSKSRYESEYPSTKIINSCDFSWYQIPS